MSKFLELCTKIDDCMRWKDGILQNCRVALIWVTNEEIRETSRK